MLFFKTQTIDNKTQVFDPLRRQWVSLTPEEQVRQKMLYYLVETRKGNSSRCLDEHADQI